MRDQLAVGLVLAGVVVAAAAAGLAWLAVAASLAAIPFLVTGIGFAVGGHRAARERAGGTVR